MMKPLQLAMCLVITGDRASLWLDRPLGAAAAG